MFRVINFTLLIRGVAIITTFLSILIYNFVVTRYPDLASSIRLFTLAPIIALVLTFLIVSKWPARLMWSVARYFNGSLYPDLNGVWEGEIVTENNETFAARAIIRQALLHTEIDMHTETAKSVTLEATPVMEGGQFKLYYSYRAKPKKVGYGDYTGTTIFDIRMVNIAKATALELSGYYYTDRLTRGSTRLRQISSSVDRDVTFY